MEGFSETEAGQKTASVGSASAQISDTSSASSLTAGMGLRLGQGTEEESTETGVVTRTSQETENGSGQTNADVKSSPVSAQTGAIAAQSSAVAAKPILARSENTKSVAKQGAESAHGSRPAHSINVAKPDAVVAMPLPNVIKPDAVLASPLPETLPEPSLSLAQTTPATAIASPALHSTNKWAQHAQTEIFTDRMTNTPTASVPAPVSAASTATVSNSTSVSASVNSSVLDLLNTQSHERTFLHENAVAANAAVRQTANEPATSANPAQASPVSNLSSTSSLIRSETQTSIASKSPLPPVVMLAEGGNLPETSAQNHSQPQTMTQMATQTVIPAETNAPVRISSPVLISNQTLAAATPSRNMIQAQVVSQSHTQTSAPSTQPVEISVSSQAPTPTLVFEQNRTHPSAPHYSLTQGAASSKNPIQAQAASQSPARTSALSMQPVETSVPSQAPAPTFVFEQNQTYPSAPHYSPTQGAASDQNPIQAQAISQSTTQSVMPSTNTTETSLTSQTSSPSVIPDQNLTPTAAPSRNPIQTQAASQSPAQTAVPSTITTETPALSHNPSPASTPDQSWTQRFVQNQEQISAQPVSQGVNVAEASIPVDGLNALLVADSAVYQPGQISSQSPLLGKPGSARGVKTSTSEPMPSSRSAGVSDSVLQSRTLVEVQSSGPAANTLAIAHAYTGAGQAVNTAGAQSTGSTASTTGPDVREAFATLDAAGTPGKPAWIHAGAQRAEAGFQDPALGWVGVRADMSGGGVHAQLVPGSADAAQALGGQLAGLNAYLAEHHTPVDTLTLQTPLSGGSGSESGQGAGQGMQQGAGQETAQGADASSTSAPYSDNSIQSPAASLESPAFFGDMGGSIQTADLGGYHISVMA
jgi:hypothetical protein